MDLLRRGGREMYRLSTLAGLLCVLVAGSAGAQNLIGDPPPLINGTDKAKVVYSIAGVVDSTTQATYVSCTSLEKTGGKNISIAVEFFDNGTRSNDVTAGDGVEILSGPGDTDGISTRAITGLSTTDINTPPVIGGIGAARILSTSTKIICAAFVVDPANGNYLATLPVFKALKQSGN